MTAARQAIDLSLSEEDWQQQIITCARANGWLAYHTYMSKHSAEGFPDLVLVKPPRIIFWECKTERKRSQPSPEQEEWIRRLKLCRQIYADFVRPHHWDDIEKALR